MRTIIASVAAAALLAVAPAMAKENAASGGVDQTWNENKKMLQTEGQNREPGPNGTFQGKPVVEGPADWHGKVGASGAASGDASSGASAGEAGSSSRN